MKVECRPIDSWPGARTDRPKRSNFSARFSQTMSLLRRELEWVGADVVVIELDVGPFDLRNDGWPYASAKFPPPVKLSFNSNHGPLVYATDRFDHWHDNVRAIALGLEALRRVDRYGITDQGQQYAGWKALPPGTDPTTRDEAIHELAGVLIAYMTDLTPSNPAAAIHDAPNYWLKRARQATHPDSERGDEEAFLRVQALGELIGAG